MGVAHEVDIDLLGVAYEVFLVTSFYRLAILKAEPETTHCHNTSQEPLQI